MINKFFGEYRWLSNFWAVEVVLDGVTYNSTEAANQAAKTLDMKEREEIRAATTFKQAKHLGYLVTLRKDWEKVKLQVMEDLLQQKFKHPDLRAKLIATYPEELIEKNTWNDTFWGQCKGKGENHLGKLLMKIREELIRENNEKI